MLLMSFIISVLAVVFSIIFFLVSSKKNGKLTDRVQVLEDHIEENHNGVKNIIFESNNEFKELFYKELEEQLAVFNDKADSIKNERNKLGIEEAIVILQKQEKNWFDSKFTSGIPASDKIEKIIDERYVDTKEKLEELR